jgi:hypothetical protein
LLGPVERDIEGRSSRASGAFDAEEATMRRLSVALVIGFAATAFYACGSNHDQGSGGSNQKSPSGSSSGGSSGDQDATTAAKPDPNSAFNGAIGKGAYWLQNTSLKVQPTTAPGPLDGEIDVEGPRDSVESYQIVLHPTGGGMKNVSATATDLTSDGGPPILAANVTLYRQFFIDFSTIDQTKNIGGVLPVPKNSPTMDPNLPDPLIPFVDPYSGMPAGAPFDVDSDKNLPIWVDIHIPKDAVAGSYAGSINVTSDGQQPMVVPISLHVWDLTLPDSRSITTYFKIDWGNVNGFHKGLDTAYPDNDPATKVIVKRYQELAHTHRIDPLEIWVPYPNGCTPPTDWSSFDSILQPYMDGTYWDDKVPSTYFGAGIDVGSSSCTETQYAAVAKAWSTHLKAKGWFNQTYAYAIDEPNDTQLAQIEQQSGWAQEGDPDWKPHIIDTTMPRTSTAPMLNKALGIYVVCLKCFDTWELMDNPSDPGGHVYGRSEWPSLFQQGIGMWFYESVAQGPPYPGFGTNTLDAAEPRIMMWGSWFEGATGFLYYSITQLDQKDPWGPNISFPKTGDGVLVYPGNHNGTLAPAGSPSDIAIDGPVPSLRLKMVRTGLQDWALFKLADQHGLTDMVRTQVSTAYQQMGGCQYQGCNQPSWYWKTDYKILSDARRAIATALINAGVH